MFQQLLYMVIFSQVSLCSALTDIHNPLRAYMSKAIEVSHSNEPSSSQEQGSAKPCCYPKTWQGVIYSYNSEAYVEYAIIIYEDSVTQNLAADVSVTTGDSKTPRKFSEIINFDSSSKSAVLYVFDKVSKTCQSGKLANSTYDNVSQQCMPADAFYFGTVNLGIVAAAHLEVQSWMWKPDSIMQPDIHYERIVTSDCAPTMEIYRGKTSTGQPLLKTDYFFNIQTTISDPSVFKVPDYCKPPITHNTAQSHSLMDSFLLQRLLR